MMPDAHSRHDRDLEYENLRLEVARLRSAVADMEEFLQIIHQDRMFNIWRVRKAGYRRVGVSR